MLDDPILWEWLSAAVRWLHVITAIAWIGSSFYFIALDLGLRRAPDLPPGTSGEAWQVHGGGFYHIEKYLVVPDRLPEHLTWFKWESYATWASGMALMGIVYYAGAALFLVDATVLDIAPGVAVAVSLASLGIGWAVYNFLCKSLIGRNDTRLMLVLYAVLVALSFGYVQVFSGRAAFVHLGALTATIMTANVFLVIIPNQKIVVADLRAGRIPDARYGVIAKQRSTHNNYLTLPVLFLMLSTHYPLAFATQYNWVIASLVFLMGVSIRHYFNTIHAGKGNPLWTWAITAMLFAAIVWLSTLPRPEAGAPGTLTARQQRFADAEGFADVADTVLGRCAMCHAAAPGWDGIHRAPKGIVLENPDQIAARAREIYLQAGRSHAMPPGNVSLMEAAERAAIVRWYETAVAGAGPRS